MRKLLPISPSETSQPYPSAVQQLPPAKETGFASQQETQSSTFIVIAARNAQIKWQCTDVKNKQTENKQTKALTRLPDSF